MSEAAIARIRMWVEQIFCGLNIIPETTKRFEKKLTITIKRTKRSTGIFLAGSNNFSPVILLIVARWFELVTPKLRYEESDFNGSKCSFN